MSSHVLGADPVAVEPLLLECGIVLRKKELLLDPRLLLRVVLDRFFGASTGLVDSLVQHFPSPVDAAKKKV